MKERSENMNIKNLYVVDAIVPTMVIGEKLEEAIILRSRICKKEIVGRVTEYIDLDSDMSYSEEQKIGYDRIDEKSLRPLSDYYSFLGLRKINNHSNRKEVREKVKTLRKNGKI